LVLRMRAHPPKFFNHFLKIKHNFAHGLRQINRGCVYPFYDTAL